MSELTKIVLILAVVALGCVWLVAISANKRNTQQMPVPGPNQVVITNGTDNPAVCEFKTINGCDIFVCWQGYTFVSVVPLTPCTAHAKATP